VELFNTSSNLAFDLSGWNINGLGYTFPEGSYIAPRAFRLLAKNLRACVSAYGTNLVVSGLYDGNLQANGETLTLLKPGGGTNSPDVVIDKVRYEPSAPWPPGANGSGASLQLIDPAQDRARASNWSDAAGKTPRFTPGGPNNVGASLPPFPALWINEVQPENVNSITDNNGQQDPWIELYNAGSNSIALAGMFLSNNYTNLGSWTFPAGAAIAPGEFKVIFADAEPAQSTLAELHTSFRLAPGSGSVAVSRMVGGSPQVIDYVNYSGIEPGHSYGSFPDGQPWDRQAFYSVTPGGTNNGAPPPITVSINEWMADNTSYRIDPATGQHEDWFEIYNPADAPAGLSGYFLTDTFATPFKFQVPPGFSVPAHGFLMVWADNKPSANTTNSPELHVGFKLGAAGEAIGIFSADGAAIDTVVFGPQTANVSEGRFPDGGTTRFFMSVPTAGAANFVANTPPPQLNGIGVSGGQLLFSWQSTPGQVVQVEFSTDLSAGWVPIGDPIGGDGSIKTVTQDVTLAPQGFFRLRILP
jgi:hypothetical protein